MRRIVDHILGNQILRQVALPFLIRGNPRDPVPFIALARQGEPVCWLPGINAWLVTGHSDVKALFGDSRITTDPRAYERYEAPKVDGAARWLAEMPFRTTPSNQDSLGRRLVLSALKPRAIERNEHRIGEVVEEFAVALRQREGVVDLLGEFTAPVSTIAIGRVLGVPPKSKDEARFRVLARQTTRGIQPFLSRAKRRASEAATVEIAEYILNLVEARRREPGDDLISDLVSASQSASPARSEDIVRVIAALIAAGSGTTGVSGARALRSLLLHPSQLSLLRSDRSLLGNAVQELLRYDNGLLLLPRYVLEGFEFRGRTLKKGQLVLVSPLGANRDPRVFPDPDRLDIRRDTRQALTFGYGAHYCPGANVALTEIRLMVAAAIDFIPPNARLLEDQIRWSRSKGLMAQIKSLPARFDR